MQVQVGSGKVTEPNHWKVGVANIFISALEVRPFLGVIQSYRNDSGCGPVLSVSLGLVNQLETDTRLTVVHFIGVFITAVGSNVVLAHALSARGSLGLSRLLYQCRL